MVRIKNKTMRKIITMLLLFVATFSFSQSVPFVLPNLSDIPSATYLGTGRSFLCLENNQLYIVADTMAYTMGAPYYNSIALSGGRYANAIKSDYDIGNDLSIREAIDSIPNEIKDEIPSGKADRISYLNNDSIWSVNDDLIYEERVFDTIPVLNNTFDSDLSGWTNSGPANWLWESGYATKTFYSDVVTLSQVIDITPSGVDRTFILLFDKSASSDVLTASVNSNNYPIAGTGTFEVSGTILAGVDSIQLSFTVASFRDVVRFDNVHLGFGRFSKLDINTSSEFEDVTASNITVENMQEGAVFRNADGLLEADSLFMHKFVAGNPNDKTLVLTKNVSGGSVIGPSMINDSRESLLLIASRGSDSNLTLQGTQSIGSNRPNLVFLTAALDENDGDKWTIYPRLSSPDTALIFTNTQIGESPGSQLTIHRNGRLEMDVDYADLEDNDAAPVGLIKPLNGSGAPSVAPRFNGDSYFDYTNSKWYRAFDNEDGDGTGDGLDSDDWVILN
jgi:hypothetical protein